MVIQVILILLFLFMMIGAVVVIGVDGTLTPENNGYQDRHHYENELFSKEENKEELSRFLKPKCDWSDPKQFNAESFIRNNDRLESETR